MVLKETKDETQLIERLMASIGRLEEENESWKKQCAELQKQNAELMILSQEERDYQQSEREWQEKLNDLQDRVRNQEQTIQRERNTRTETVVDMRRELDKAEAKERQAFTDGEKYVFEYVMNSLYDTTFHIFGAQADKNTLSLKKTSQLFKEDCKHISLLMKISIGSFLVAGIEALILISQIF